MRWSSTGRRLPARRPDPGGRILIVGNLPYSVGKPILMALAGAAAALAAAAPTELALMLQKEVAERVAAEPGGRTYGSLSVLSQLVFEVRLAFTRAARRLPPAAPGGLRGATSPRADGAAGARRRSARLRAVVRAAFAQRRKSLANALAGGLGLPAERARAVLADLRIDPTRRAETLSLAEFARLAAALETA